MLELKGDIEKKMLCENQMHALLKFDDSLKIRDEIQYVTMLGGTPIVKVKKIQEGHSLCKKLQS